MVSGQIQLTRDQIACDQGLLVLHRHIYIDTKQNDQMYA